MRASYNGRKETVKILVEQEGIDLNAKDILLFLSEFILIIWYFKIINGNYLNYGACLLFTQFIIKLQ